MPQQFHRLLLSLVSLLAFTTPVFAGKFAAATDGSGYHPHTENRALAMPPTISVAVPSSAPHTCEMATEVHSNEHEALIHLPMVPPNKQSLEKDMLHPEMSSEEIERVIRDAVSKVPNVVSLNNHMGSTMTSSLFGIQKVMQALERYDLCFLDNMTIGSNQTMRTASGTGVKVVKRKVLLDDTQDEADIRRQSSRAAELARHNGSVIVIGHPHPSTVRVLQQILYSLSVDITLVHPNNPLNEPQVDISRPNLTPLKNGTPDELRNPSRGMKLCKPK